MDVSTTSDHIIFPKSHTKMVFQVDGVFAFPDQWKTTDQANAGLFTYTLRTWNAQFLKSKIHPKQLTEKELRQQEEAKNKKGGKKQAKKEDPAQQQRLKKLKEQQEEQQRIKQQQWQKLSPQQQFYSASQDSFKSPLLKFENNTAQIEFQGKMFVILEERILKDGGDWIYFCKVPTANEEQLAKMKKSKPKTLNLNDLNPIVMRAWMDLSNLNSTDNCTTTIRCKLEQIQKGQDIPQPNLQKTYIKLTISLEQPLLKASDGISGKNFIKNPPQPTLVPASISCVTELKQQLRLAIQSLAMQYSSMFWKQLNIAEQIKNTQIFTTSKRNQSTKRKQQFLYDFNVSGKYKILKDRIKKAIVHICQNKYANQMKNLSSFTGVTCNNRDQFYSEIYHFLMKSYKQTMTDLIKEKAQYLREVDVPQKKTQKQYINRYLNEYNKETIGQMLQRTTFEYQALFQHSYGLKIYKHYMQQNPQNTQIKFSYSLYCLKNNLQPVSSILPYFEQHLQYHKDSSELQFIYLLLLTSSQNKENAKKVWAMLRQLIQANPSNVNYLLLASILFEFYLQNLQLGEKYFALAQRACLKSQGKLTKESEHKNNPSPSQVPSSTAAASYSINLNSSQKDKLYTNLINLFSSYNLFNVIQKIIPKLSQQNNSQTKTLSLRIQAKTLSVDSGNQQNFKQLINQCEQLYNNTKSSDALQLFIELLFSCKEYQRLQKYLKISLSSNDELIRQKTLLRLGYYYYLNCKYGNSRACFTKYLEKRKYNSGYSWRILGSCLIETNELPAAIECLRHANLMDKICSSTWMELAKAYAAQSKYIMVNQCLNQYQYLEGEQQPNETLKQLIQNSRPQTFYDQSMKQKLIHRLKI